MSSNNRQSQIIVYHIHKALDPKQTPFTNKIPSKLVNLSTNILANPLSEAINHNLASNIFRLGAQVATVITIVKKKHKKNCVSNVRPVSLSNCFSKVFWKIGSFQKCNLFFPPYVSAYGKHYYKQYVLLRFLEEWRGKLDNNFFVGCLLVDSFKTFDWVTHDLLIAKLAVYAFNMNLLCYICSYLASRKQ